MCQSLLRPLDLKICLHAWTQGNLRITMWLHCSFSWTLALFFPGRVNGIPGKLGMNVITGLTGNRLCKPWEFMLWHFTDPKQLTHNLFLFWQHYLFCSVHYYSFLSQSIVRRGRPLGLRWMKTCVNERAENVSTRLEEKTAECRFKAVGKANVIHRNALKSRADKPFNSAIWVQELKVMHL